MQPSKQKLPVFPFLRPWDWTLEFSVLLLKRDENFLHDGFDRRPLTRHVTLNVWHKKNIAYVKGCLLSGNTLISYVCFGVWKPVLVVWCLAVICRCSVGYSEASVWSCETSQHSERLCAWGDNKPIEFCFTSCPLVIFHHIWHTLTPSRSKLPKKHTQLGNAHVRLGHKQRIFKREKHFSDDATGLRLKGKENKKGEKTGDVNEGWWGGTGDKKTNTNTSNINSTNTRVDIQKQ